MPLTHQHQTGDSLGAINRENGDVLQVARCAECPVILVQAEDDTNWHTIHDHVRSGTPSAPASLI